MIVITVGFNEHSEIFTLTCVITRLLLFEKNKFEKHFLMRFLMLPFLVGPAAHLTETQVRFMADLVFITRTFLPILVPDRSLTIISTLFVVGFFLLLFFF